MSRARDGMNLAGLSRMLGGKPPREAADQPLATAASGGGGGGAARPIDWPSPDETMRLQADSTDAGVSVILSDDCGSQILLLIKPDGAAKIRVIGCDGVGYALTPTGLAKVSVTGAGTEEEEETIDEEPAGWITITGCVDGENRSIRVIGEVLA